MLEDADFEQKELEYKAQIETLTADLDTAIKTGEAKDKEIQKLNAYIARYVCSDKPSKDGLADPTPKTFNDIYKETLSNMAKE